MAEEKTKKTAKKASTKKEEAKVAATVEEVTDKKAAKKAEKEAKKAAKQPKEPEQPKVTEAHASAKSVRVTPRKTRLVLNLIRGRDVDEAIALLKNLNKAAATPVRKLIQSAAANATNNFHMDGSKLYVAEIQASDGIKMKRYMPRGKGSASSLIKRTSNIRVTVKERE